MRDRPTMKTYEVEVVYRTHVRVRLDATSQKAALRGAECWVRGTPVVVGGVETLSEHIESHPCEPIPAEPSPEPSPAAPSPSSLPESDR